MSKLGTITRRTFLIGSAAIAGGVVFGYWKYKQPFGNPLQKDLGDGEAALTPYVLINNDGISIIAARGEMGQGVHTSLAALVAEELDVSLESVNIIHGPASSAYYNEAVFEEAVPFATSDHSSSADRARNLTKIPAKFLAMQVTGGSSSIRDNMQRMRVAGAAAREVLLKASVSQLGEPVDKLRTENGRVIASNGDSIAYTDLAVAAAEIEPSAEPVLKPKSEWKILGQSQNRVDVIAKSTGTAQFGIDVELPGMLYASIKVNPRLGAAMNSYNADKASAMPGVEKIITVDNGAAVIATNTWYAFKAVNAIEFDWAQPTYPNDTAGLNKAVENSFNDDDQDSQFRDDGDVETAMSNVAEQSVSISAEYRVPYLAHAAMEPMNATAWVHDDMIEIWAGNQIPTQVIKEAVAVTGFDEDAIKVNTLMMGGSFGRRLEMDFIAQVIKIAHQMPGTPVKLTWTREEDMTHDSYRPLAIAKFQAVVEGTGPRTIDLHIAAPSVNASQMSRIGMPWIGPDIAIVQAAFDQPYAVENYRVTGYRTPSDFPVSSWRSVGASHNGFFHECMMDEIAYAKGLDPLQMRINLVSDDASKKVLQELYDLSDWDATLPEGHGRGIAFSLSFGVPTAEVIEIAMQNGKVKITKAYAVVDVGIAIDPRIIQSQVSGALSFGLAAAMMGNITITDGKIDQTNFHSYDSIRINQAPEIEVRILENLNKIRGIGEPGTPPAAPALANAIFSATGRRIRELPLNKSIEFV